jgi:hypothetical protein
MGLQLKRTPVIVTRLLLGSIVVTLTLASPLASVLAGKIAAADATPNTSKIHFSGAARYISENSASDLAAQLTTYASTSDVNFFVDGKTDEPIVGSDYGGGNFHTWRLYAALPAGKHTLTAQVRIGGEWYAASNTATVYSLDMPDTSYVFPNDTHHIFKSSDNPLRISVDDEFDQFRNASFSVFSYDTAKNKIGKHIQTFSESRSACDLSHAGKTLFCDLDASSGWSPLPEGAYKVKLTTNSLSGDGVRAAMEEYWVQFTVDDTKPSVSDFRIEGGSTVKDSLTVSTNALDTTNLESVDFYITEPRDDGTCSENGVKLAEHRVMTPDPADGRYRAILDVSGIDTKGKESVPYCVTAVARDEAGNNSDLSDLLFVIDHKAPVITLKVTSSKTPSASTPVTLSGMVDGKAALELFQDGMKISGFNLSMDGAGQWSYVLNEGLDKGNHVLKIVATDQYGNSSTEVSSPESYASLAVGAYAPPEDQSTLSTTLTPPKLSSNQISPAPSVAQIIASQQQKAAATSKNDDEAILGAATTDQMDPAGAAIAASSRGWTFFGIAWYWWLLSLVAIMMMAWRMVVRIRRNSEILPA